MKQERRFNSEPVKIEVRAGKDGKECRIASGYASVFNKLSDNLGGFREIIAVGAFDDVLEDDVRVLFNHDPNHILARNKAETLTLAQDEHGLFYEFEMPDTTLGRDLTVSMERGDVNQSSFAFTVEDEKWDEDEDGRIIRTITKVKKLYDVSPVTYPAYPEATVGVRSLEIYKENKKAAEQKRINCERDIYNHRLRVTKLKGAV